MTKNIRNIHSPLMICLHKMLEAELKMNQFHSAINESPFLDIGTPELGLLDHALTAMGFPEDNSTAHYCASGSQSYQNPNFFCRDWLYDKWFEVDGSDSSISEFITWAQGEAKALA